MFKALSEYQFIGGSVLDKRVIILEPLCVVFRLSLLQYKEKGTKLSIHNNSIEYQGPSYDQGLLRKFVGDSREDLHHLYHPILKVIDWYPYNEYNVFYSECIKGLEMLYSVYEENSTIRHTLSHYISVIQMNDNENYRKDTKFNPIIDTLKDIWSPAEIKSTTHLLLLIKNDKNKDIYLESLEMILKSKEEKVNEYLKRIY
tara:strand:+ start:464 stop:1066 length:603 start_codon:yes stop_codon:yes gene_type:complete